MNGTDLRKNLGRRTAMAATLLLILTAFAALVITQTSLTPPPSGTWATIGSLAQARAGASSALLADGRLLVTGGAGASGPVNSAELFSIAGSFSAAAPISVARQNHISVTL